MQADCPAVIGNYIALLQQCRHQRNLSEARRVHAHLLRHQLDSHPILGNFLVPMLVQSGSLSDAQHAFDRLTHRDVYSWTSLISGYTEFNQPHCAFQLYQQMQDEKSAQPNKYTYLTLLNACAKLEDLDRCHEIHMETTRKGLEMELYLASTFVDTYTKCGLLVEARHVFDRLVTRDTISWNALIAGYADHGLLGEVLNCYKQMQMEGVTADDVTLLCSLKACGIIGALQTGQEIHAEATKKGLEGELKLGSTIVDMYSKCGSLSEAQQAFDHLAVRNIISWNVLITGYAEHRFAEKAESCIEQMQLEGVSPDDVTFIWSLKACGAIGALKIGHKLHAEVLKRGFEKELFVGSILVDMYGKCSSVVEGRVVFDKLPVRGVVSWTAMIQAYGENHEGNTAVQCFEEMQGEGVKPNSVTFTCLLAACSHASLVYNGQAYFTAMREQHNMEPLLDHYACMVDLYARSGLVHEAERFIAAMKQPPSNGTLTTLLNSCKLYGKVEVGEKCFHQLVEVNQEDASAYLLVADMYAGAGRWKDANRVEEMRRCIGKKKTPGTALVEVGNTLHDFVVGGNQSKDICDVLEIMNICMKVEGYIANLDMVLGHLCEEEEYLYNFSFLVPGIINDRI